jgi:hypothetical protein
MCKLFFVPDGVRKIQLPSDNNCKSALNWCNKSKLKRSFIDFKEDKESPSVKKARKYQLICPNEWFCIPNPAPLAAFSLKKETISEALSAPDISYSIVCGGSPQHEHCLKACTNPDGYCYNPLAKIESYNEDSLVFVSWTKTNYIAILSTTVAIIVAAALCFLCCCGTCCFCIARYRKRRCDDKEFVTVKSVEYSLA